MDEEELNTLLEQVTSKVNILIDRMNGPLTVFNTVNILEIGGFTEAIKDRIKERDNHAVTVKYNETISAH